MLFLDNEFINIIKERRSCREFKKGEIKIEVLKDIVDAGRLAPSPHNIQPWEFIILHKKESCDSLFPHLGWLFEPSKDKRPSR